MSLFQIEHPDRNPTIISAAALVVDGGFLHATKYGGSYQPGSSECVASWAPGTWHSYRAASTCPTCGKDVAKWD